MNTDELLSMGRSRQTTSPHRPKVQDYLNHLHALRDEQREQLVGRPSGVTQKRGIGQPHEVGVPGRDTYFQGEVPEHTFETAPGSPHRPRNQALLDHLHGVRAEQRAALGMGSGSSPGGSGGRGAAGAGGSGQQGSEGPFTRDPAPYELNEIPDARRARNRDSHAAHSESYAQDIVGGAARGRGVHDLGTVGRTQQGRGPSQFGSIGDFDVNMPNLNPSLVGTGVGMLAGPLVGIATNLGIRLGKRFLQSRGFEGSGEFTPDYMGGQVDTDEGPMGLGPYERDDYSPVNSSRPRSPYGGSTRAMGGYISRAGNVQGQFSGRENMFQMDMAPGASLDGVPENTRTRDQQR